ncbi:hypothetical protein EGM85_12140 [Macrococcus caseolyticus]|nr:hypothetical protein [Macrococcus caseolyticus]RKO09786.1 hypothetical protein D6861_12140 [Macrococcus caseolyticus]
MHDFIAEPKREILERSGKHGLDVFWLNGVEPQLTGHYLHSGSGPDSSEVVAQVLEKIVVAPSSYKSENCRQTQWESVHNERRSASKLLGPWRVNKVKVDRLVGEQEAQGDASYYQRV